MKASNNYSVSDYIIQRLQELGIEYSFGVPGDYILSFVHKIANSDIKWIGTCNELNAGYAADGYARIKGIGVAVVTYGVGAFSILNAVAGAYSEQVPLIIISGAPHSARRRSNALMHHLIQDYFLQHEIFKKITVDSGILNNPYAAPEEIDRIISNCIKHKKPVYIEIPIDIAESPCDEPKPLNLVQIRYSDPDNLKECVKEAVEMFNRAKNPVVIAGVELLRFGLAKEAMNLVEQLEVPFATTVASKSVLPELHPQFIGMYQGSWSRKEIKEQIENSDCVLSLGVWLTDFDTGGFTSKIDEQNVISANYEELKIKRHYFKNINLADFINKFAETADARSYLTSHPYKSYTTKEKFIPEKDKIITAERFYRSLNGFLTDNMVLLAEPGDAICAISEMEIEEANNFIVQAYYLSIGYCTPASLGVSLADKRKRAVVLTGDGAFQMTAQEISNLIRFKCNPIFFLINNKGYLIERMLHDDGPFNDIQNWSYHKLPSVMGENVIGLCVRTEEELAIALETASKEREKFIFIELQFKNHDCSAGLYRLGETFKKLAGH